MGSSPAVDFLGIVFSGLRVRSVANPIGGKNPGLKVDAVACQARLSGVVVGPKGGAVGNQQDGPVPMGRIVSQWPGGILRELLVESHKLADKVQCPIGGLAKNMWYKVLLNKVLCE